MSVFASVFGKARKNVQIKKLAKGNPLQTRMKEIRYIGTKHTAEPDLAFQLIYDLVQHPDQDISNIAARAVTQLIGKMSNLEDFYQVVQFDNIDIEIRIEMLSILVEYFADVVILAQVLHVWIQDANNYSSYSFLKLLKKWIKRNLVLGWDLGEIVQSIWALSLITYDMQTLIIVFGIIKSATLGLSPFINVPCVLQVVCRIRDVSSFFKPNALQIARNIFESDCGSYATLWLVKQISADQDVRAVKNAIFLASDAVWGNYRTIKPYILIVAIESVSWIENESLIQTILHSLLRLVEIMGLNLSSEWHYVLQSLENVKETAMGNQKVEKQVLQIFEVAASLFSRGMYDGSEYELYQVLKKYQKMLPTKFVEVFHSLQLLLQKDMI